MRVQKGKNGSPGAESGHFCLAVQTVLSALLASAASSGALGLPHAAGEALLLNCGDVFR